VNKPEQESGAGGCARIMCGGGDVEGEGKGRERGNYRNYTPATGFRCEQRAAK